MRAVAVCALIALLPAAAGADGMTYYYDVSGEMGVQATGQRAVLWLNEGTWELHLQPVFERSAGAAAWVVPFPVRPDVSPGRVELFDQLELLTAPVFVRKCYEPCCDGRCDGGVGDGGGDAESAVTIWEQGQVGELDYVVLSAAEGEDAIGWLEHNGYLVPEPARGPLSSLAAEGAFFFAARLSAGADPDKPLSPVRFGLPGMASPAYPLRTTAAGVGQAALDLTLYLIAPAEHTWWPEATEVGVVSDPHTCSPAEYRGALDALFEDQPDRFLALTYRGKLAESDRYLYKTACEEFSSGECIPLVLLSAEVPAAWADEIDRMAGQGARVLRFEGRLSAADMASDLVFHSAPADQGPDAADMFVCDMGPCRSCDDTKADGPDGGCSLAAHGSLVIGAWLFIGLLLLLGLRRRGG